MAKKELKWIPGLGWFSECPVMTCVTGLTRSVIVRLGLH